jgi:uncharacterized protein
MLVSLPILSEPAQECDPAGVPGHPDIFLFETDLGPHLFVVNGSRVYGLGAEEAQRFAEALGDRDPSAVPRALESYHLVAPPFIDDSPVTSFPVRSLSLAVAQKCNLGCAYCYAQEGNFGGPAREMPLPVALGAVELLFREVRPGDRVQLAFLGGEPLLAREVVQAATESALALAQARGVAVGFSITTNGTRLTPQDGDFFERHGFAVTVSLDGVGETHDQLRPFKGGRGTFETILTNVAPLLARQRRMQVSARVTVTPRNLELPRTLDALIRLGFHSVGFSPMLASPTGREQMERSDLEVMLEQMIACGTQFERRLRAQDRYPFANLVTALREIHRGTHRPYPCGAGAGYFGVSAEGELAACHRYVEDSNGALGSVAQGVDIGRQARWLAERHVHRQEPCRSCWARYLCGGGCHHEVIHRGRPACDYIRGWLHYCLQAYVRLLDARPDWFTEGGTV